MARSQWMDAGASQTSAGQARRGAVIALSFSLAMAFGLAACTTSKPSPTPSMSSSPSPSVSARPTPSSSPTWLPLRPDSTKTRDAGGALATTMQYLSLYGYVLQTGDLSVWESMATADCKFCASVADHVRSIRSAGHTVDGGTSRPDLPRNVDVNSDASDAVVRLSATHDTIRELDSAGTVVAATAAATDSFVVGLSWTSEGWKVRGVEVEARP